MKTYNIAVTETYCKNYEVKAESLDEAFDLADERARDDNDFPMPEYFTDRTFEQL